MKKAIKIVKGNDFRMRIPVCRIVDGEKEPYPLPACTDLQVNLIGYRGVSIPYVIDAEYSHVLVASVENVRLSVGLYALEVKGKLGEVAWRSMEYAQIQIVDNNEKGDVDLGGTQEGEPSVLMDTAIVILAPDSGLYEKVEKAEGERRKAESDRQAAERGRDDNEQKRMAAEKDRVAAEEQRYLDLSDLRASVDGKQNQLVSGQNLKTINGQSLLGGGDMEIAATGGYTPPEGGVPRGDLAKDVQAALDKADSAVQRDTLADYETKAHSKETYQLKGNYLTEHQDISGLAEKSEIPVRVSQLANDADYATRSELFSGDYNALKNKPTIPAAYNDSEIKERMAALEQKEDKDTVYDDSEIREILSKKQDVIGDLEAIREGAEKGATAVQAVEGKGLSENDYTDAEKAEVAKIKDKADKAEVAKKQDVISDLEEIRRGAEAGATAVQPSALTSVNDAINAIRVEIDGVEAALSEINGQ